MAKSHVKHDNARYKKQVERMQLLEKKVGCFFCKKNYLKVGASELIYENKDWYIKKNDFPYQGTVYHYLIAPKKHITQAIEISNSAWINFSKSIAWLDRQLKVSGYSLLVRSGDMRYTGATLDHLHFHVVSGGPKKRGGKLKDNVRFTLAHKSTQRPRS